MHFVSAEAGVGIDYQDLTRQDVEEEPTGMYLWRVLVGNTRPSAPTVKFEPANPPHDRGFQLDRVTWVTSYPPYVESETLLGSELYCFAHWCECFSVNGAGSEHF